MRPLVIYHKQLGDLLLMEPALAKLAGATRERVRLSTRAAFLPMVALMEHVDGESGVRLSRASEVISFSANLHAGVKAWTTFAPVKRLREKDGTLLKAWHRWVYPDGIEVPRAWGMYRARHYYDAMPCDGVEPFRLPRLRQPPAAWRHPQLPSDYILLHGTSAWPSKSWPAESWVGVLDALHAEGIGPFVLTGGGAPWEQEFARRICGQTRAQVVNLGGSTRLEEYLYAVSRARMVLCIDGSSSHLAAAFERPAITLFGSTPVEVWHYPTELASAVVPPEGKAGEEKRVGAIPMECVVELAREKLARTRNFGGSLA
jgi:ADP-heptose:LPS heptosyltransferase